MMNFKRIVFASIIILTALFSCKKDQFITDYDAALFFSTDTVMFDTVFTGIGSAVRHFRVYNPHDLPIKISEIKLAKGEDSKYRLNINGTPANFIRDLEIEAKDSIFIFVDVNIDPNRDEMIESDQVQFITNGNRQAVNLLAFGQDIHFINGEYIGTETWTSDKPYLIYNSVAIEENHLLSIEAGTHLYFHRNSYMIVKGTLSVKGTYEEPVIFEGDRLNDHSSIFFENDSLDNYTNVAGQWGGIWLTKLSKNNSIEFAHIKNAVTGIQVDSARNLVPQLNIDNSIIEHHSFAGIFSQGSRIVANNCLISDCGYYNVAITRGGAYEFYHCTLANYWSGARNTPTLYINNFYQHIDGSVYVYNLENVYFGNCIIWGYNDTEIGIDAYLDTGINYNYLFENCVIKIDSESEINIADPNHFLNIIKDKDPNFADIYNYNYQLGTSSSAINKGNIEITNTNLLILSTDLKNRSRMEDSAPDIGAYEFY